MSEVVLVNTSLYTQMAKPKNVLSIIINSCKRRRGVRNNEAAIIVIVVVP